MVRKSRAALPDWPTADAPVLSRRCQGTLRAHFWGMRSRERLATQVAALQRAARPGIDGSSDINLDGRQAGLGQCRQTSRAHPYPPYPPVPLPAASRRHKVGRQQAIARHRAPSSGPSRPACGCIAASASLVPEECALAGHGVGWLSTAATPTGCLALPRDGRGQFQPTGKRSKRSKHPSARP